MPSGAALLAAVAALLAGGYGERFLRTTGLRRRVLLVWIGLAIALSAINLPLGAARAVLVNAGGTVVPAAFCALLLAERTGWGRRLGVTLVALLAALPLATVTAWGEMAAVGWPASVAAGIATAAVAAALARDARETLAAVAGALALAAVLRWVGGAAGWTAWPAALGGESGFDAGVVALLCGQVGAWVAASGTGRKPVTGADSPAP